MIAKSFQGWAQSFILAFAKVKTPNMAANGGKPLLAFLHLHPDHEMVSDGELVELLNILIPWTFEGDLWVRAKIIPCVTKILKILRRRGSLGTSITEKAGHSIVDSVIPWLKGLFNFLSRDVCADQIEPEDDRARFLDSFGQLFVQIRYLLNEENFSEICTFLWSQGIDESRRDAVLYLRLATVLCPKNINFSTRLEKINFWSFWEAAGSPRFSKKLGLLPFVVFARDGHRSDLTDLCQRVLDVWTTNDDDSCGVSSGIEYTFFRKSFSKNAGNFFADSVVTSSTDSIIGLLRRIPNLLKNDGNLEISTFFSSFLRRLCILKERKNFELQGNLLEVIKGVIFELVILGDDRIDKNSIRIFGESYGLFLRLVDCDGREIRRAVEALEDPRRAGVHAAIFLFFANNISKLLPIYPEECEAVMEISLEGLNATDMHKTMASLIFIISGGEREMKIACASDFLEKAFAIIESAPKPSKKNDLGWSDLLGHAWVAILKKKESIELFELVSDIARWLKSNLISENSKFVGNFIKFTAKAAPVECEKILLPLAISRCESAQFLDERKFWASILGGLLRNKVGDGSLVFRILWKFLSTEGAGSIGCKLVRRVLEGNESEGIFLNDIWNQSASIATPLRLRLAASILKSLSWSNPPENLATDIFPRFPDFFKPKPGVIFEIEKFILSFSGAELCVNQQLSKKWIRALKAFFGDRKSKKDDFFFGFDRIGSLLHKMGFSGLFNGDGVDKKIDYFKKRVGCLSIAKKFEEAKKMDQLRDALNGGIAFRDYNEKLLRTLAELVVETQYAAVSKKAAGVLERGVSRVKKSAGIIWKEEVLSRMADMSKIENGLCDKMVSNVFNLFNLNRFRLLPWAGQSVHHSEDMEICTNDEAIGLETAMTFLKILRNADSLSLKSETTAEIFGGFTNWWNQKRVSIKFPVHTLRTELEAARPRSEEGWRVHAVYCVIVLGFLKSADFSDFCSKIFISYIVPETPLPLISIAAHGLTQCEEFPRISESVNFAKSVKKVFKTPRERDPVSVLVSAVTGGSIGRFWSSKFPEISEDIRGANLWKKYWSGCPELNEVMKILVFYFEMDLSEIEGIRSFWETLGGAFRHWSEMGKSDEILKHTNVLIEIMTKQLKRTPIDFLKYVIACLRFGLVGVSPVYGVFQGNKRDCQIVQFVLGWLLCGKVEPRIANANLSSALEDQKRFLVAAELIEDIDIRSLWYEQFPFAEILPINFLHQPTKELRNAAVKFSVSALCFADDKIDDIIIKQISIISSIPESPEWLDQISGIVALTHACGTLSRSMIRLSNRIIPRTEEWVIRAVGSNNKELKEMAVDCCNVFPKIKARLDNSVNLIKDPSWNQWQRSEWIKIVSGVGARKIDTDVICLLKQGLEDPTDLVRESAISGLASMFDRLGISDPLAVLGNESNSWRNDMNCFVYCAIFDSVQNKRLPEWFPEFVGKLNKLSPTLEGKKRLEKSVKAFFKERQEKWVIWDEIKFSFTQQQMDNLLSLKGHHSYFA